VDCEWHAEGQPPGVAGVSPALRPTVAQTKRRDAQAQYCDLPDLEISGDSGEPG